MFVQLRAVLWVDLPVCCFLRLTWGANWTNLKQSSQAACLGVSQCGCVGAGVHWSSRKCLHVLACNSMGVLEQVFSGHLGSACTSWRVTEWLYWSRCSLVIYEVPAHLGVSRSGCTGAGVLWSSRTCLHILTCHGVAVLEQVFSGHLEMPAPLGMSWRGCVGACSLVIWKVPQGHMRTVPSFILLKRWALIALFVAWTGDLVNSAEVVGSTAT